MSDMACAVAQIDERSDGLSRTLIGQSAVMQELRRKIVQLAPRDLAVLVRGESGVGKELVARALHAVSGRSGRLVAFNVAETPASMFADAMFGHVRGAFTGALNSTTGYLAEANRGTIFLDEIGSLHLDGQNALLRAIEEKEFRPVGGARNVHSDFRVVAATNENLGKMVLERRFRGDLLQRLTGFVLKIPPLSSRIEDIPELVQHILKHDTRWQGAAYLGDHALGVLQRHPWSGNVRELQQVLGRAVLFSQSRRLSEEDISAALDADADAALLVNAPVVEAPGRPTAEHLSQLVRAANGDIRDVARRLGVSRPTIYRWLSELELCTLQRRRRRT